MHSVSIVGCGYTGLRVAQRWLQAKRHVRGFGNRPDTLKAITGIGAAALAVNLDGPLADIDFAGEVVYYTVPPAPQGERDSRLERLLEHVVGVPARFIYLSTTGVYGNHAGGRVDEDTQPAPATARAVRRLAAESALRAWADSHAVSWCILRVPGIYGPGRLPVERLQRREPAIVPEEATPSNRIHVEDLVTACVAAGTSARADGRIYNVTDGSEDSLTGYLQRVARIGNLPFPPLIARSEAQKTASATSWSFLSESRRVDNRRMLEELGVTLAFRDLDQGIRASFQA